MTTQTPAMSQHLAAAQKLLDELDGINQQVGTDSQTKAVTAAAEAILVLAEQVAAIRVLIVGETVPQSQNGHPDAVSPSQNGQPAPQDEPAPKKRGWW